MKTKIRVNGLYINKKGEACEIVEYDDSTAWPFTDHRGHTYDSYGYYGEPSYSSILDLVRELTPEKFPEYFV